MIQTSTSKLGEQTMKETFEMTTEVSAAVRPPEGAGRKRLSFTYERVATDIEAMGLKMSFDSAKKDAPDPVGLGSEIGAIIGKEMSLAFDEKDQVVDSENLEEVARVAAANPMEIIRQSMLQTLPEKPVKPGDSWPVNLRQQVAEGLEAAVKGTYTFRGMGERAGVPCTELLLNATFTADMAKPPTNAAAKMGIKLERGTMKGTVWFDPMLAAVRESDIHQEVTLSLKITTVRDSSVRLTRIEDLK
ncbi:MAG: hypothetical protein M3463_20955 [Verrucomicrobiota bacterium]|nr:hypothetical protein [Verrucomicrobiota bacterium]